MIKINAKAISVNKAYRGRRYATNDLKDFKMEILWQLPKMKIPDGKLEVKYIFGCSSKGSDGDNLIKAFQDCLSEFYNFNDNKIYKWIVEKVDVQKGNEFIKFEIKQYEK